MKTDLIQCLEEYNSLKQREDMPCETSVDAKENLSLNSHRSVLREEKHPGKSKQAQMNPSRLLKRLNRHNEISDYHIDANDLAVISGIYQQTRENFDLDFSIREILGFLPQPLSGMKAEFEYMQSLLDRGILSFSYPPEHDFHTNLSTVVQGQYRLNSLIWSILLGKSPLQNCESILSRGFKLEYDPLELICDSLELLFSHYPDLRQDSRIAPGMFYGRVINKVLEPALNGVASLPSSHWLSKFVSVHGLDPFWQKCLYLIYFHQNRLNVDLSIPALSVLVAGDKAEHRQALISLGKLNVFRREGLLEYEALGMFRNDLSLTDAALTELTGQTEEKAFDLRKVVSQSAFFSPIETPQTLDQLILPVSSLENVRTIIARLNDPRREEIARWGLIGASLSGDESIQQGCNILLHGGPGTGKTFIAGVLAKELDRPLIMINANNIREMFYGSTEKRARALFREMRLITKEANPVFLLNEGDQLIHKRGGDMERSADATENAIQSIFLEEMETFPGILVVTSNLVQNLDPAMSRRFHYKLEIPAPDQTCRLKLWKLHLPATIPGAADLDLESLAGEFPFTGGQIRIVVQNACHAAFSRGSQAKLTRDDLYRYSLLEFGSSFETQSKVIGFR
jgi:hypothetical protein